MDDDVPVAEPVDVLQVGAEGGSIRLIGQRITTGWRFCYSLLDQSARLLDEGDPDVRRQSRWVRDWNDALTLLDRYPWATRLAPLNVHPDFAERVLVEATRRILADDSQRRAVTLNRWVAACSPRAADSDDPADV